MDHLRSALRAVVKNGDRDPIYLPWKWARSKLNDKQFKEQKHIVIVLDIGCCVRWYDYGSF